MATRSQRERLEVSPEATPEASHSSAAPSARALSAAESTAQQGTGRPADADPPYVEPDQYGLRTSWQSEAVRIEAAEFLLATRVQDEKQWRLNRVVDRLRLARRAERGE